MTEIHPSLRMFQRYLKEQNLPVTTQRQVIAEVVVASNKHLSVEQIEDTLRKRGNRIGKATIYRTLDLLVRSRLVVEHDFGEGFKQYEHRFSRESVFEHLICIKCGDVIEFESREIQDVKAQVTAAHGFQASHHKLEIYGLCKECLDRGIQLPDDGLTCPIEIV